MLKEELQKDLTKVSEKKCQINFSVDKCKVMCMWKNNLNCAYIMLNFELAVMTQERDHGVLVDNSLKTPAQCFGSGG